MKEDADDRRSTFRHDSPAVVCGCLTSTAGRPWFRHGCASPRQPEWHGSRADDRARRPRGCSSSRSSTRTSSRCSTRCAHRAARRVPVSRGSTGGRCSSPGEASRTSRRLRSRSIRAGRKRIRRLKRRSSPMPGQVELHLTVTLDDRCRIDRGCAPRATN